MISGRLVIVATCGVLAPHAIGAAVLGFNLLGDALRDAYDPRTIRVTMSDAAGLPEVAHPV